MRKIGFIGAYDKTDLILYIAKILTALGNKVLIIDSSVNQKAKYIVPVINPTKSYVIDFEEIDIAVGFNDFTGIKDYLGMSKSTEFNYDIALIDIDSPETFNNFDINNAEINFFVTSFDVFSLKKGLEILNAVKSKLILMKIIYSTTMLLEDDRYLNFLAKKYNINWAEEKIYFSLETGDLNAIIENQKVAKVKFKNLSSQYKENLEFLTEIILQKVNPSEVKKVIRNIEKL